VEERPGGDAGGTRVTAFLGPGLAEDADDLLWGRLARKFQQARRYGGKTCAWWYDEDSFYELLQAAAGRPLADLVEAFDGFGTGKKDREPSGFIQALGLPVASGAVTRPQAAVLLAEDAAQGGAADFGASSPGDWEPHVLTRGPRKGTQVWRNHKTGAYRDEPPTGSWSPRRAPRSRCRAGPTPSRASWASRRTPPRTARPST
jgi:hypothetical protein